MVKSRRRTTPNPKSPRPPMRSPPLARRRATRRQLLAGLALTGIALRPAVAADPVLIGALMLITDRFVNLSRIVS